MNSTRPIVSPETTDLERRVLAHERVLQALIAYMARTEPRFIDHLRERFVEPMRMARHENDYRETDDYAQEFIGAIVLLAEVDTPIEKRVSMTETYPPPSTQKDEKFSSTGQSSQEDRVQLRERNGIWEVIVDGKFRGDYYLKEHAVAAAALHKLSEQ